MAAGAATGEGQPPRTFAADFELGGSISFVLESGAMSQKVHDIEISKIRANCEEQAAELDFVIYGNTKVLPDRTFAVRSETKNGRRKALVRARFSRDYQRAKGTVRVWGKFNFDGTTRNCDTTKQEFVARVTG